jgi:phosphatidate cytidylyltransferase
MHSKRLAVSLVFLPLFYLYIMCLPPILFFCLLLAVSSVALLEFYSMYHVRGVLKYVCLLVGAAILAISFLGRSYVSDAIILASVFLFIIRLFIRKDPSSALSDLAAPVVGILYIPGLLSFQGQLRLIGPEWIIFLYATVWAADSLAYYIGKGIGRRKLYREVSPNKTVAGAVGSLIGGIAGALLLQVFLIPRLGMAAALSIGMMVGIVTLVGDLVESMFKRDAGVKDSGTIIPGHGGILDKLDGSLFAGPLLYLILRGLG